MIRKISFTAIVLNFVLMVLILLNVQENSIPIHFNYSGETDGWGSKWIYLIFSVIPLIFMAGAEVYWRKKSEINNESEKYALYQQLIPIFCWLFILSGWVFLFIALNPKTGGSQQKALLMISTGFVIMVLSNFMGKVRRNAWYGIRVPWTLMNDVVWDKTHRLGGYMGVISGLLMIVGGILEIFFRLKWLYLIIMSIAVLLVVAIPIGYSVILYYRWQPSDE